MSGWTDVRDKVTGAVKKVEWRDVGNVVATAAPWVGSLLGGPAGAAAGKIVAELLGTDPTPEAVQAELAKNPEAFVKLREAEITQQTRFRELESQDFQTEVSDRDSARKRQVEVLKAGVNDFTHDALSWLAMLGFFAATYMLFIKPMPSDNNRDALLIMLGALVKIVGDVYSFHFGSSRGSRANQDALAAIAKQKGE